jgi:hypothetical protein
VASSRRVGFVSVGCERVEIHPVRSLRGSPASLNCNGRLAAKCCLENRACWHKGNVAWLQPDMMIKKEWNIARAWKKENGV